MFKVCSLHGQCHHATVHYRGSSSTEWGPVLCPCGKWLCGQPCNQSHNSGFDKEGKPLIGKRACTLPHIRPRPSSSLASSSLGQPEATLKPHDALAIENRVAHLGVDRPSISVQPDSDDYGAASSPMGPCSSSDEDCDSQASSTGIEWGYVIDSMTPFIPCFHRAGTAFKFLAKHGELQGECEHHLM